MLVLSFHPFEGAVLDFSLMTDAEFQQLRRNGCRIECNRIQKLPGNDGSVSLGFEFPRSVRVVRSTLIQKEPA